MVKQEDFAVEKFMDEHETNIKYNLGETCCYSLSLNELSELSNSKPPTEELLSTRMIYGWIRGSDKLKSTISLMYDGISPKDIVITNGAIGANFLTLYGLVGEGDHVIAVNPTYQQLHSVPKIFGATVDLLDLKFEDGFQPNLETLKKLVKPNTKLIIINNPNNPTGVIINTETMMEIVEIAKSIDAFVLCDEVYRPLYHSLPDNMGAPKSIVELYNKGISTSSVSKAFSFAGLRIGWIVSKNHEFIEDCFTRRDYNTISISMADDILASYVLNHREVILQRNYKLCQGNLAILESFINSSNGSLSWVKPHGGSTAFVKVNKLTETYEFASELAERHGTLVVPGEVFNFPGYLRIGFANSEQELVDGLRVLRKVMVEKGLWIQ